MIHKNDYIFIEKKNYFWFTTLLIMLKFSDSLRFMINTSTSIGDLDNPLVGIMTGDKNS